MAITILSRFGAFVIALLLAQLPQMLKPVDDASQDPTLAAARSEAIDALRAGSPARFMAVVGDDPSLGDFGHGRQVLQRMLDSDTNPAAAHPTLIDEILTALSMGGAFTSINGERRFCAPYVYGAYPSSYPMPNDTDPPILVIVRPNVDVKVEPDPASRTIARLSYRLVRVGDSGGPTFGRDRAMWHRIEIGSSYGFVPADAVRAPDDYHVCFAKRDGRWVIVSIVTDQFPHR